MPISCQLWSGFEEREYCQEARLSSEDADCGWQEARPHPKGQDPIVPMKATTVIQDN